MTIHGTRGLRQRFPRKMRLAALVLLFALLATVSAPAQQLSRRNFKGGSDLRLAFRPVVALVCRSTAEIRSGDEQLALAAIVSADGLLLTKASQLQGPLACRLPNGRRYPARIVATDRDYDLALLKIEARGLTPVVWSQDKPPAVGQWVATGWSRSVPKAIGTVSVEPRQIPPSSGALGVALDEVEGNGPRVAQVLPNSAAEQAGVRVGDVIVALGDLAVGSRQALFDRIGGYRPGEAVELTVHRGEEKLSIRTVLGRRDSLVSQREDESVAGERSVRRSGFPRVLEHDSVLQPNECGGPIVDLTGKVIGINIARAGRTSTYAVPTHQAQQVLRRLRGQAD